ncbi:hypothetical protein DFS34DRAFT_631227 [Phlyctochytrium arcticum]|nr:hypothetical protein DFS34DRAFT_631227 [Phlyctochytrium arcticum]
MTHRDNRTRRRVSISLDLSLDFLLPPSSTTTTTNRSPTTTTTTLVFSDMHHHHNTKKSIISRSVGASTTTAVNKQTGVNSSNNHSRRSKSVFTSSMSTKSGQRGDLIQTQRQRQRQRQVKTLFLHVQSRSSSVYPVSISSLVVPRQRGIYLTLRDRPRKPILPSPSIPRGPTHTHTKMLAPASSLSFDISQISLALPSPPPAPAPTSTSTSTATTGPAHYLFGYGSLINPQSRLRTVSSPTTAIPAVVRGLQRSWDYICPRKLYTAVGVRRLSASTSTCNGVLIPITHPETDLPSLDLREKNYRRTQISLSDLSFPFSASSASATTLPKDAIVWVYELDSSLTAQQQICCSTTTTTSSSSSSSSAKPIPIPQSYLDCILTGCLLYGPTFALDFLLSTTGWDSTHWINDRDALPAVQKYVRDIQRGETLCVEPHVADALLRQVVPAALAKRVQVLA